MDLTGSLINIVAGASKIDEGRRYLTTDGLEHAGRLLYEEGIAISLDTFKKAQATTNPQTMVLVELTFLQQELQFCDEADNITRNSLTQAIQNFEDTLRCLKTVENSALYRGVETSYLTTKKESRYHGFPRDAVHQACDAHRTRIQNILRSPGINMIEKAVLTQRAANMMTIHASYTEKQRKALEKR